LAQHNDVVLFPISDPSGTDMPTDYRIVASDGQLQVELDTGNDTIKAHIRDVTEARLGMVLGWGRKYGLPILPLTSAQETLPQLLSLLGVRAGG
jgi:hypothetical protein